MMRKITPIVVCILSSSLASAGEVDLLSPSDAEALTLALPLRLSAVVTDVVAPEGTNLDVHGAKKPDPHRLAINFQTDGHRFVYSRTPQSSSSKAKADFPFIIIFDGENFYTIEDKGKRLLIGKECPLDFAVNNPLPGLGYSTMPLVKTFDMTGRTNLDPNPGWLRCQMRSLKVSSSWSPDNPFVTGFLQFSKDDHSLPRELADNVVGRYGQLFKFSNYKKLGTISMAQKIDWFSYEVHISTGPLMHTRSWSIKKADQRVDEVAFALDKYISDEGASVGDKSGGGKTLSYFYHKGDSLDELRKLSGKANQSTSLHMDPRVFGVVGTILLSCGLLSVYRSSKWYGKGRRS